MLKFVKQVAAGVILVVLGIVRGAYGRGEPPRLVLFIVVDQMREDTFDRFGDLFEGGFKYLQENGVRFSEAHQAHAYPATAPGHFALATGRYPASGGIIGNSWYDRATEGSVYCVEDKQSRPLSGNTKDVSYRNVQFTALGDWMKLADGKSKVYSIAGKDRSAVLMGGKSPNGVFWFDFDTGDYVTTTYYATKYPPWLSDFNTSKYVNRFIGADWSHLLSGEMIYLSRSREDDFPGEMVRDSETAPVFPHHFTEPETHHPPDYQQLWQLPWLPEVSLRLAREILRVNRLGRDPHPDILWIGISVTDAIGHDYGPFSQEVMDTFLRLDRMLGAFFHDVSQEVDLDDVLIVLSSDHGAAMLPEYARKMGMDGGRYGKRYTELLSEWNGLLEKRWGPGRFIDSFSSGSVYYDYATLTSKRVTVRQMDSVMIPLLMRERWIHKVYTRAQMMSPSTLDQQGRLWRNEFNPDRSGDLFVVVTENWVARGSFGTGHGTSHPYDTHVPLILSGRGLAARMIEDRVETVDVAPTVATLLGIPFPSNVDGKVLHLEGLPTDRRMD